MGLRDVAARDLQRFQENRSDFAWAFTLTDPDGTQYPDLSGYSTDISLSMDVQTGQQVSNRTASISVSTRTLADAGAAVPYAVTRRNRTPWLVTVEDISGTEQVFKVADTMPDQAIGNVVLMLEAYDNG